MSTSTASDSSPPKLACVDAALQLALCMEASSPCVQGGGKIAACLKAEGAPPPCVGLHHGYFACRRNQVNNRARIRGKKFRDTDALLEDE
jgi:hypothetical protein